MSNEIYIPRPARFSFGQAVNGHGWSALLPFEYDDTSATLNYVFRSPISGPPVSVSIGEVGDTIRIETTAHDAGQDEITDGVRHVLRFDDDLEEFYSTIQNEEALAWISRSNAGRLLRSH